MLKDIRNLKFGSLVVLRRHGTIYYSSSSQPTWLCRCECGREIVIRGANLRSGNTKSCGCKQAEGARTYLKDHLKEWRAKRKHWPCKLTSQEAGRNDLYSAYRKQAEYRSLVFSLTLNDFGRFIQSSCHYCETPPLTKFFIRNKRSEFILYNGVDRKDSSVGYILDNCVPCCKICNRAKQDLSYKEFWGYIFRIQSKKNPVDSCVVSQPD